MENSSEGIGMNSAPESGMPQVPFLWTRGVAARETLNYLDKKGVDAEPLLSKAELSRRQLQQDPGGVSVVSQHRFLELAAIQMNDPLLGLHVAAEIDLREIGLLFYLAAASATVSEALEYLSRYAATSNEEIRLEISHHKDEAVLTFQPVMALDVASRAIFRTDRAVVQQGAAQPDEPGLCSIAHELCARPEFGAQGGPPYSAMPGRVRAGDRLLGIAAKRHASCRSSPRTAASWVSWRRMADHLLDGAAGHRRAAGNRGKPARQRACRRQGPGGRNCQSARHERAVTETAARGRGYQLR